MNRRPILGNTGKIGIVNRGEAAVRCIRAVREYNTLYGTTFSTAAFYIDKEKDALFAREADTGRPLSSLPGYDPAAGNAYLNRKLLTDGLISEGCAAVWAGWGFLSEDAPFIEMLENAGLVFLGPSSQAMALLGDKIAAKELAERSDVPILAWSRGPVGSLEEARRIIDERIGYPCIVKASNAGGGRGIRFVRTPGELESQYRSAVEETVRITGGDTVFIERLVERGRHLEVQVLADRHGTVKTFGVRDCSVQRRNQKIIEETPPPLFPRETVAAMEEAATRLIEAARYESAGTVEFLYDLDRGQFYFMEVNTRLQVEHPITEQLYGIDLVKGQLLVATGNSIASWDAAPRGASVEVRLNAEDPDRDFIPAPGKVTSWKFPAGPGIRVDSGIEQGSEIPQEFDSMIAKIISYAPTREEAFARLERALREMRVGIEGGTTNRAFLMELLGCPEIRRGGVHTKFVEELLKRRSRSGNDLQPAVIAAAVYRYREQEREERKFFERHLAASGIPRETAPSNGLEVNLRAEGSACTMIVKSAGEDTYHIGTPGGIFPVTFRNRGEDRLLVYAGTTYQIQIVERGDILQVEVNGFPYSIERESGGKIKAPSPALVLSVRVREGQNVGKGDVLLTLEAMKMEMLVTAPEDGQVKDIFVSVRDQVSSGQPLLRLEPSESRKDETEAEGPSLRLAPPEPKDSGARIPEEFRLLREAYHSVFLGYDHAPDARSLLTRLLSFASEHPDYGAAFRETVLRSFEMYASIEKLFSGREMTMDGFARPATCRELLRHFIRLHGYEGKGFPKEFVQSLDGAASWYAEKTVVDHGHYVSALFRIYKSHADLENKQELLHAALLECRHLSVSEEDRTRMAGVLDEITFLTQAEKPSLADAAINARYELIDKAVLEEMKMRKRAKVGRILALLRRAVKTGPIFSELMKNIVDAGNYVTADLAVHALEADPEESGLAMEIIGRRFTRDRIFTNGEILPGKDCMMYDVRSENAGRAFRTLISVCRVSGLAEAAAATAGIIGEKPGTEPEAILLAIGGSSPVSQTELTETVRRIGPDASRVAVGILNTGRPDDWYGFAPSGNGWEEDISHRGFSPIRYRELRVHRLCDFNVRLQYASESVFLLSATAKENPRDERLFAFVEVPSVRPELNDSNMILRMVSLENVFMEVIHAMRAEQARRKQRLYWNRIIIHIRSVLGTTLEQIREYAGRLATRTVDLGIEKFIIYSRRASADASQSEELELLFENISGSSFTLRGRTPSDAPLKAMDEYVARVVRARQRGTIYPYEIIKMITRSGYPVGDAFPKGDFEEFDIVRRGDADDCVSVKGRAYGMNTGNIVFGIITNYLPGHDQGLRRVIVLSDTTADLGSLAEEECRRINAAIELASRLSVPVEWIPVSAGARIDMTSGTENLDWTAATLRKIIEFTQNGGEINIIVSGINVGAQSYWNAEATMLMHTKGLLIMTDDAAMLLTGKKALDFSGSVSAENNVNIGGAERIMGPNGQAQIRAKNLYEAYRILFRHYSFTYVQPGKRFPDRRATADPFDRDVCRSPYTDTLNQGFILVGDIFSPIRNPEKKKPFDMRQVMKSVIDSDTEYLERWLSQRDGETAIVWEARIGGCSVGLIGIESRSISRIGNVPYDGPEAWNGGTLFPLSSKKVARGINAFSGKLPLVIMANLSGFDGSPESLRKLQLEYGAEIGRAIVNFKGPIVFVVTARYHGGAYVVFSKKLNPRFHSVALEGSYASVIGGAPAAAVVFPGQVNKETNADARVVEALRKLKENAGFTQKDFDGVYRTVHKEKETELAAKFDGTHSVERAKSVGSIDEIIHPSQLRPYVIRRVEIGIEEYLGSMKSGSAF